MPVNNAPTSEVNANRVPLPDARTVALRDYCVALPDDPQYLALLLGAIGHLAQQQTYQRDTTQVGAKQVAAVWRDVYDAIAKSGFVPCGDGGGGGNGGNGGDGGDGGNGGDGGGTHIMITEDNEDDMKPCYEKFGGTWYIGLPCGPCGGLEWVPLGSGGGPPGSPGDGGNVTPGADGGGYPANTPALFGSSEGCYADKAAGIYVQRVSDWSANIIDLIGSGLDFVQEPTDAINLAAQAIDVITSGDNYTSLEDVTKQQVASTLETYQQALANAWPDAGEVGRAQLYKINADVFPNLDGAVPIRRIADWFASFGNIRALNARIAVAQAECASGTQGALGTSDVSFEVLGNTYKLITVPAENLGTVGVDFAQRETGVNLPNLWGAVIDLDILDNGNNSGHGVGYDSSNQWRIGLPSNAGGTSYRTVVGDNQDLRDAIKSILPAYADADEQDFGQLTAGGSDMIIYDSGGGGLPFDSDVTPNAMYLVYQV